MGEDGDADAGATLLKDDRLWIVGGVVGAFVGMTIGAVASVATKAIKNKRKKDALLQETHGTQARDLPIFEAIDRLRDYARDKPHLHALLKASCRNLLTMQERTKDKAYRITGLEADMTRKAMCNGMDALYEMHDAEFGELDVTIDQLRTLDESDERKAQLEADILADKALFDRLAMSIHGFLRNLDENIEADLWQRTVG